MVPALLCVCAKCEWLCKENTPSTFTATHIIAGIGSLLMFENVPLLLKLYQLGAISLCNARVVNKKCFVCFFFSYTFQSCIFFFFITLNNFGFLQHFHFWDLRNVCCRLMWLLWLKLCNLLKNIKAVRVPGQDVINIVCSPVVFFRLLFFLQKTKVVFYCGNVQVLLLLFFGFRLMSTGRLQLTLSPFPPCLLQCHSTWNLISLYCCW